jgi:hypothetical protein
LVIFVSMIANPGNRLFTGGNDGSYVKALPGTKLPKTWRCLKKQDKDFMMMRRCNRKWELPAAAVEPAPAYPADVPSEQAENAKGVWALQGAIMIMLPAVRKGSMVYKKEK